MIPTAQVACSLCTGAVVACSNCATMQRLLILSPGCIAVSLTLFDSVSFAGSQLSLLKRSPGNFTASYSVVGELVDPEPLPK
jgi:hypothetical protein